MNLQAELATAERKLAWYRERAFGVSDDNAAAFMDWFGLQPARGTILAELYAAKGAVVPLHRLRSHLRSGSEQAVRVHIAYIRAAVSPKAVRFAENGYALTPEGVAECEKAMAQFGAVA